MAPLTRVDIGGILYIPAADAARTTGLSREYITRLARAGKLPAHRIGRNWLVSLASLRTLTSAARS